jgi:hypothetical protein
VERNYNASFMYEDGWKGVVRPHVARDTAGTQEHAVVEREHLSLLCLAWTESVMLVV